MVNEPPLYFVKEGYLYGHIQGISDISGGITFEEPSYDNKIGKATPHLLNKYIKTNEVYSYDENKWLTVYISDFKDAFDNEIFIGDNVLIMDCYYDGSFKGYVKGEVTGFTKEFVKIKPIKHDRLNLWFDYTKLEFLRKPYRIIVIED